MSSVSCWGTTPSRPRIVEPCVAGSMPSTRSVPAVTGEMQPIMRIVLVLPAPLGPRKPKASPGATSKSMASTAVKSPKRLVSPRAWMSAVGESVDTPAMVPRMPRPPARAVRPEALPEGPALPLAGEDE